MCKERVGQVSLPDTRSPDQQPAYYNLRDKGIPVSRNQLGGEDSVWDYIARGEVATGEISRREIRTNGIVENVIYFRPPKAVTGEGVKKILAEPAKV